MEAFCRWPLAFVVCVLVAGQGGAQERVAQDRGSQGLAEAISRAAQPRDLAELILATKERSLGEPFDAAIRAALKSRMEALSMEQLGALAKQGELADIPAALGSVTSDLVYTPVIPCRVFDSRPSQGGPGPIAANSQRNMFVSGTIGFPAQGGLAGGCGVPVGATSVIVNFVAVGPAGPGNIRAWAVADPQPAPPLAAVLNYGTVVGLPAIANGVAVPLCNPAATSCALGDLRLQADTSATNILGDVVGYFGPVTGLVTSVNSISGPVTIASGSNISVTPSGSTLTIAYAPPTCAAGQVLQYNGSAWVCATVGVQTGCSAIDILPCYAGPPGTLNVGVCRSGFRTCDTVTSTFGACTGQVLPIPEIVGDGFDNDCAGPNVSQTAPANLATGVAINTTVSATFADMVDPATISASTFLLSGPGGPVSGTVSYSAPTATFTPGATLAASATYTASLTVGVKDLAGRPLAAPYNFSFTTSNAPVVTLVTPGGVKHALIPIQYTLFDAASGPATIVAEFSTNGGSTWAPATRFAAAIYGESTTGLATSPGGTSHHFYWSAQLDGVGTSGATAVRFRITPFTTALGAAVSTADFQVNNNYNEVLAMTTGVFPRNVVLERTTEVALGDLTADALRAAAGTTLFMQNGGGIRSTLPSSYVTPPASGLVRSGCSPATPCHVVRGDAYTILPFGNEIAIVTVTGAQVWQALNLAVGTMPASFSGFMQISGFSFVYSVSALVGARVQSVTLSGGAPLANDGTAYTLGLSDYNATGGDGYALFAALPATRTRVIEADVLAAHMTSLGTLAPATFGRITQVP